MKKTNILAIALLSCSATSTVALAQDTYIGFNSDITLGPGQYLNVSLDSLQPMTYDQSTHHDLNCTIKNPNGANINMTFSNSYTMTTWCGSNSGYWNSAQLNGTTIGGNPAKGSLAPNFDNNQFHVSNYQITNGNCVGEAFHYTLKIVNNDPTASVDVLTCTASAVGGSAKKSN